MDERRSVGFSLLEGMLSLAILGLLLTSICSIAVETSGFLNLHDADIGGQTELNLNMYGSEIARSPWRYGGDVYTAPNRDWAYDTALNDLANLPPHTPSVVYTRRVLWDDRLPLPLGG
jgi:type II secretory pathway pseudopilin PulG